MTPMNAVEQHHIEITLDITSVVLSLQDLELALLVRGGPGSRTRGDTLGGVRVASETILRLDSGLEEVGASLYKHVLAIQQHISASRLHETNLPIDVVFNIAVYFETACATTTIDVRSLAVMAEYRASVEVSAYPISVSA